MKRKSVIRELFYNNPCVIEKISMTDKYSQCLDVADKLETELREKTKSNEEVADLLRRFIHAGEMVASEESFSFFKEGLKFGMLLCMELAEE